LEHFPNMVLFSLEKVLHPVEVTLDLNIELSEVTPVKWRGKVFGREERGIYRWRGNGYKGGEDGLKEGREKKWKGKDEWKKTDRGLGRKEREG
jgi:hypothetical protein